MKLWRKPAVIIRSMQDLNKYIKANAGTCILRFTRS